MTARTSFLFAAALAAASLAATALPANADETVTATSGATIYSRPFGNGRTIGRVPRYTELVIDYCTPPDHKWCHIIWDDGPNGWVRGANLSSPFKQQKVTPFMSIFEPGWPPF